MLTDHGMHLLSLMYFPVSQAGSRMAQAHVYADRSGDACATLLTPLRWRWQRFLQMVSPNTTCVDGLSWQRPGQRLHPSARQAGRL